MTNKNNPEIYPRTHRTIYSAIILCSIKAVGLFSLKKNRMDLEWNYDLGENVSSTPLIWLIFKLGAPSYTVLNDIC